MIFALESADFGVAIFRATNSGCSRAKSRPAGFCRRQLVASPRSRYRIEMVQVTFGYGLRWFIHILYNFLRSLSIGNRKIPLQIHIASANQKMEQCTRQMPTHSPSTSAEIPPAGAPSGFDSAAIIGFSIRRYTAVPLRSE